MQRWFQHLFKSKGTFPAQQDKDGTITQNSVSGVSSSASTSSQHSSLSPGTTPLKSQQLDNALNSELRWKRKYDVFVCHSSSHADTEEAKRLVLFLEAPPRCLRCFLSPRDGCPGAAISTEFCQAVQDSHIRALIITPSFLQDDWCNYIMHQVLAEGPMSNRMIPLLQNMPHSQYPQELKFYFYIDLSRSPNQGYGTVYKTVLRYLETLVKREKIS
ncbi:toll/interleukin-1 receptor domain-containing adapter protein [Cololabis saira]|uniref:toll/interleukin-1 receptor domain-containing adapter protein n=1 Tax=Cololabis saira TaxID=129043 RepID=UPI002AD2E2E6|nr:toll/interleukin-1 receptor domain-containing adapter protein [Cololabis saira]